MKINLLPPEERPLKQSEVRWEFLVALLAILLVGLAVLFAWMEKGQVAALTRDLNEAKIRELSLQRQVQEIQTIRSEIGALEEEEKVKRALLNAENDSLKRLPRVMSHGMAELWIEGITWTDQQVNISGYSKSMTALSRYLNHLNEVSEEASLAIVRPLENTGFVLFTVEVKGVQQGD